MGESRSEESRSEKSRSEESRLEEPHPEKSNWHNQYSFFPSTPFEVNGMFALDPYGALFWTRFSEFVLRPHLQFFSSFASLIHRLESMNAEPSERSFDQISRKMRQWQRGET